MLTGLEVAGLKPGPKPYKRFDRDGLYLIMTPAGGRTELIGARPLSNPELPELLASFGSLLNA